MIPFLKTNGSLVANISKACQCKSPGYLFAIIAPPPHMAWTAQKSKVATNKLRAFHPPTKDGVGVQMWKKYESEKSKHLQFAIFRPSFGRCRVINPPCRRWSGLFAKRSCCARPSSLQVTGSSGWSGSYTKKINTATPLLKVVSPLDDPDQFQNRSNTATPLLKVVRPSVWSVSVLDWFDVLASNMA